MDGVQRDNAVRVAVRIANFNRTKRISVGQVALPYTFVNFIVSNVRVSQHTSPMKALLALLVAFFFVNCLPAAAQFDFTPDSLTITTVTFKKDFPTVWKAIKKCIKQKGCALESEKQSFDEKNETYKGNITTEACVLVSGEDSTRDVMMLYGKVPMIRGGVWAAGRAQYNFAVKDLPDKTVQVVLTVELSGFENYITSQVHMWNSNGILDKEMIEMLNKALEGSGEKKN